MAKYMDSATASEIDDIAGLAISAGSSLTFLTRSGIMLPSIFAKITIKSIALHTVSAIIGPFPSSQHTLAKLKALSMRPMTEPILTSFHNMRKASEVSTSSMARPLIIRVAACEPVFPPVPMSIGMYETRHII